MADATVTPEVISRKEAKARGLKFYFTGRECVRGHITIRRTSTFLCLDCARGHDAAWKKANPEKVRWWKATWAAANSEEVRERKAERYRANAATIKARVKARYEAKPDEIKRYIAGWRRQNPEKLRAYSSAWAGMNRPAYRELTARRRAGLKTATPGWLTDGQKRQMRAIYASAPAGYHVDHIVPINGKTVCGLHVPWNLQVLSAHENLRKSARFEC